MAPTSVGVCFLSALFLALLVRDTFAKRSGRSDNCVELFLECFVLGTYLNFGIPAYLVQPPFGARRSSSLRRRRPLLL